MGNARELFLTNKDDTAAVYKITTSEAFQRLCVMSMAEMAEKSGANAEQMAGANYLLGVMRGFADPDEPEAGLISSGLIHDLDTERKAAPAPAPKTRRKK